ncbi:MAG: hypothetical protein BWY78_00569 [Alphaproteobacteria bacterium ADurb.Bin438]|nr:MAG: hypothetical protein BWY78_00569 [Alphaproteobacteria bacterium ADurb.Bin438]
MLKKFLLGFFILSAFVSIKALYDNPNSASFMYFVFNMLLILYFALKIKKENG